MKSFISQNLEPCVPPLWATGGHAQTILGHLIPSPELKLEGEKKEICFPDGDRSVVRYFKGRSHRVVYLFHGLGGFSHSTYMQRTALVALKLGHSVIMMNHRGCGEAISLAREPYHSGRAEDLAQVIELGRNLHPEHEHVAIGFSLSGNALLLLAAGQRASTLPDAAIAVNAPIDLAKSARKIGVGLNKIYDIRFVRDLKKSVESRKGLEPLLQDFKLPWNCSLYDFDEHYTAKFAGFKNRADYYAQCSAQQYLGRIKIPTFILTSKDDPFVDYKDYLEAELSPELSLHIENVGGHMGYLSREITPLGSRRWLDYAMWSLLGGKHDFQNQTPLRY